MLDKVFGFLKTAKKYYVDHHVDYQKVEGENDTYIIGIFIKVRAPEKDVINIIPMIDKFIGSLFKKGKIIVPVPKSEADKIKKFTKIKLRFKGKDLASV